ncbi:AbrB/MazE/SpoVT family DNA-binding domain-containing protein [Companilactobacillus sp. HBUAS59544]|uniref:AbrB/MazE/SpoVT family DNA-binding domain-containing protein n=1 Tax=Companilactobacillus sp. HBUAS59544 TaxID=3109363 RepID=UPI002FEEAD18
MEEKNKTSIKPTFNSEGLLIPKDLITSMGVDDFENCELTLKVENNSLVISKKESTSKLMKKFGYLKGEEKPGLTEMDWGIDVGHEKID